MVHVEGGQEQASAAERPLNKHLSLGKPEARLGPIKVAFFLYHSKSKKTIPQFYREKKPYYEELDMRLTSLS